MISASGLWNVRQLGKNVTQSLRVSFAPTVQIPKINYFRVIPYQLSQNSVLFPDHFFDCFTKWIAVQSHIHFYPWDKTAYWHVAASERCDTWAVFWNDEVIEHLQFLYVCSKYEQFNIETFKENVYNLKLFMYKICDTQVLMKDPITSLCDRTTFIQHRDKFGKMRTSGGMIFFWENETYLLKIFCSKY